MHAYHLLSGLNGPGLIQRHALYFQPVCASCSTQPLQVNSRVWLIADIERREREAEEERIRQVEEERRRKEEEEAARKAAEEEAIRKEQEEIERQKVSAFHCLHFGIHDWHLWHAQANVAILCCHQ